MRESRVYVLRDAFFNKKAPENQTPPEYSKEGRIAQKIKRREHLIAEGAMTAFNCFFDRIRLARMFSVLEGIFVPESIGTGYGEELVSAFALVVGFFIRKPKFSRSFQRCSRAAMSPYS